MHCLNFNEMPGKKLDRNYKMVLFAVLNKLWKKHPTKQQLYAPQFDKKKTEKKERKKVLEILVEPM